jgi:TolB-like protein
MDSRLRGNDGGKGAAREKESPPRLSIVVLPFANIGGDPEQDYFVDGVTESLTTDLSRISGSFVIARNTAFTYKGKAVDLKQIGRELNVRYVLEGSVQRGGNRMRVNVQLIDAETGSHLWAERFDKPVGDLFDMQDEIVARLARAIDVRLTVAEAARAERSAAPDSMDLMFQALAAVGRGLNSSDLGQARELFQQAAKADPDNVGALAGLAFATAAASINYLGDDRAAQLGLAEGLAKKALALAPVTPKPTTRSVSYTCLRTGKRRPLLNTKPHCPQIRIRPKRMPLSPYANCLVAAQRKSNITLLRLFA